MRRLFLILSLFPTLLHAQVEDKYKEGAVPVVNGKVTFSREVSLPDQTKDRIFSSALTWATDYFVPGEGLQNKILFSDPTTRQIVCLGNRYLVFANKALSLDQAIMSFQMYLECQDGKCDLRISAIRYIYGIGEGNEVMCAEEQITDKYVFNKKKDKMLKSTGKFRIHTINLVSDIFDQAEQALRGESSPVAAIQFKS